METFKRNELVVDIGRIGEQIVSQLISGARRSDDWYDPEKDGMINEKLVYEVKTFRLNHMTQGFWVDKKQWNKVDNVDVLFFVRVPEKIEDGLRVYICINHKTCWEKAYRNDGTGVRCYPLTNCIPYGTITDDRVKQVFDNSIKTSKHERYENV